MFTEDFLTGRRLFCYNFTVGVIGNLLACDRVRLIEKEALKVEVLTVKETGIIVDTVSDTMQEALAKRGQDRDKMDRYLQAALHFRMARC
ncbi:MAG: hypothetical protein P8013_15185 [Candidatus Sulfobium sp.]